MGSDGELEVGTQYAESLVDDIALACLHHNHTNLFRFLPELDALLESWTVLAADREWNLAEEWYVDLLEILTATNGGICLLTDIDDYHWNKEAQYQSDEQDLATNRLHRGVVSCWRGDDTGIVCGKRLRQLVLLTLLEKEEIQRLLNFLLTANSLQVLRLVRIAGNLRSSSSLVSLEGAQLSLQGYHEVIETSRDALAHRGKALIIICYQWVLLAGVGDDIVALQLTLIVLGNLLFDTRALDTGISWKKLVLANLTSKIISDILSDGETGIEIHNLLINLGALLHILLCGSLYIRQQVAALEG